MKILIATPIHQLKDYSMERWLTNVAELTKRSPAEVLMVDNSENPGYVDQVKAYLTKIGHLEYKIEYLRLNSEHKFFERVARCREFIREYVLAKGYDAWFSWECDQIIPSESLVRLVGLMELGNFMIVSHNNWTRGVPDMPNFDFGVTLIKREALEKYSFLLEFGTDPEMPDSWEPGEEWFRRRVLRGGGSLLEADGVLKPVYHLDK